MKKIVKYAIAEGFTNLLVFNEDQKHVNGLLMVHLPGGPTAHFKLSSIVQSKGIKVGDRTSPGMSPARHVTVVYCYNLSILVLVGEPVCPGLPSSARPLGEAERASLVIVSRAAIVHRLGPGFESLGQLCKAAGSRATVHQPELELRHSGALHGHLPGTAGDRLQISSDTQQND